MTSQELTLLENQLSDFDPEKRKDALRKIAAEFEERHFASTDNLNLHFHSFYSYNSEGWSPSRIAWEAKKHGLFAAGVVDFDVIDGLEEFLEAAALLALRSCVGVETRTFFERFAGSEIDSPGEPGVNYAMGVGFARTLPASSPQARKLDEYRLNAKKRNLALISRVNSRLPEIAIDFEKDVAPLTPSGNATERHIVSAYVAKTIKNFPDGIQAFSYLSAHLGKPASELELLYRQNRPAFDELMRAKFAKKGGIGYVQPSQDAFPPMKEFLSWVRSSGAIPTEAWLDGTSEAESGGMRYLEASRAEGAEALNIIPDRNWNIKDPESKRIKTARLSEIADAARRLDMPVFIGTEMNKAGQPFVDDLSCQALAPFKAQFREGAAIAVGHSLLARFANMPYSGSQASDYFKSVSSKNDFYIKAGFLPPLDFKGFSILSNLDPSAAFAKIADSVKSGRWKF